MHRVWPASVCSIDRPAAAPRRKFKQDKTSSSQPPEPPTGGGLVQPLHDAQAAGLQRLVILPTQVPSQRPRLYQVEPRHDHHHHTFNLHLQTIRPSVNHLASANDDMDATLQHIPPASRPPITSCHLPSPSKKEGPRTHHTTPHTPSAQTSLTRPLAATPIRSLA